MNFSLILIIIIFCGKVDSKVYILSSNSTSNGKTHNITFDISLGLMENKTFNVLLDIHAFKVMTSLTG